MSVGRMLRIRFRATLGNFLYPTHTDNRKLITDN